MVLVIIILRPKQQQYKLHKSAGLLMQKRSAHNQFNIKAPPQIQLQISSNFDSGNLQSSSLLTVQKDDNNEGSTTLKVQFTPAAEPFHPQYSHKQSTKSFFHFSVKSNQSVILHAKICRMNILSAIENSFNEYYRICVGMKKTGYLLPHYSKIKPDFMQLTKNEDQYTLQFKYQIQQNERIYFAYHYPYSVEKLIHFLQDLDENLKQSKNNNNGNSDSARVTSQINNIYYKNELLIESVEGRPINLLTITDIPAQAKKDGCINLSRQPRISKTLFPFYELEQRPYKFNKPYIMVTCRVHPGQTSASYALEGFIQKIIGSSPEAQFLRKSFVFIIIPMINPDGVFHGTYRMDVFGHNLNRFYNSSAAHKQPSIFAVQSLLQYHDQGLVAFFDFHSHPQAKGTFAYGNAYTSIHDQIEAQVFAKLLSYYSETFNYENCTFSEKNMNSKDINDILTKDGSARVCAYKKMLSNDLCNGVHCYAMEFGYHGCPIKEKPSKFGQNLRFKDSYERHSIQFGTKDYAQDGKAIANTLAQIYVQSLKQNNANPNSSSQNTSNSPPAQQFGIVQLLREQISKQVYEKQQRFKIMDIGALRKLKNIHSLISSNMYGKIFQKYPQVRENIDELRKKLTPSNLAVKQTNLMKRQNVRSVRIVNSLQINKQTKIDRADSVAAKKMTCPNQIPEEQEKFLKLKFFSKEQKTNALKLAKQKISILPVQFQIRKEQIKLNKILQRDQLPKIGKAKHNFISQKNRLRKKSEFQSYNRFIEQFLSIQLSEEELGRKIHINGMFKKNEGKNVENTFEEIVGLEDYINKQIEFKQEQQEIPRNVRMFSQVAHNFHSYNPQYHSEMSIAKNQEMTPRDSQSLMNEKKIQTKVITQRLNRKLECNDERVRSMSRQNKLNLIKSHDVDSLTIKLKILPKLQPKVQKIKNRFDLQLKMKERYDKKFKVDEDWRLQNRQQN